MFGKGGIVYILTNAHHTTLYVGVSGNISGRLQDHKDKIYPKSFSARYNLCKFVYYEVFDSIEGAIDREKQIKAGSRKKKIELINQLNPAWQDLAFELDG